MPSYNYEGSYVNSKKDGKGEIKWKNNSSYKG